MNNFTIIIPARLSSSRLPEKLLKTIGDKTVLEHSYIAAQKSNANRVVIAADDEKIVSVAKTFGAEVVLTRKDHESGTDRLAECANLLNLADDEVIVNLQGDEPFMPSELVNVCAQKLFEDSVAPVSTLAARIHSSDDIANPNAVKVVINKCGYALYFSRAGIPFNRDNVGVDISQNYFHHLGIYAYRAGFLKRYSQLPASDLESLEKLEQLRILDNGEKIAVAVVDEKPPKGIDTEEDFVAATEYFLHSSSAT
ncbi:MAG: 3-deoxy-manno-octulosonate cytidylyltransferase [Gammaproteobacteria bacterium]|nr:3-deoxy-manno-octulosonate cytidylyltransferase [Gammaproteobacteria bacterium]